MPKAGSTFIREKRGFSLTLHFFLLSSFCYEVPDVLRMALKSEKTVESIINSLDSTALGKVLSGKCGSFVHVVVFSVVGTN